MAYRIRCALVLAGLLVAALQPPALAGSENRLDAGVTPVFQDVHLTLDAREPDYRGSVRVHLEISRTVNGFKFHAESMDLTEVRLTRDDTTIETSFEPGETGLVQLTANRPLEPGEYLLEIVFSNDFDTQAHGLYRLDHENEGYAFTQFEADDAREAFPCWDEPSFKFPYRMTLTVPKEHLAIFNTPIETEIEKDGWRTIVYQKTKPMPSYLLAIATGPFETVDMPGLGVPGRVVTVKGQSHLTAEAVRATPPILKALEEYFGGAYPYSKLDLIAIPEFWPGAMENPGAVTFADQVLLIDPQAASVSQKRRLAAVTAHELAHMWFGDVVTMKWWDDLWLNEAFASWMGDKITDQVFPEYNMDVTKLGGVNQAMNADAQLATRAIRKPVEATENLIQSADILAYNKGQGVLGMVERWIGPDDFRKGVVKYIERHAWGNAEGADLWHALSEASGKNVAGILPTFLEQAGFPLVSMDLVDSSRLKVSQRRFLHYGVDTDEQQLWSVPVAVKYRDDEGIRTETFVLDEATQTFPLEVHGKLAWLHPNLEQDGFYRWSLPPSLMKELTERPLETMTVRERVGFVGNLSALLDAGAVAGDDYLALLNGFAADPEPEVIAALLGALDKVETAFVPDEAAETFAAYVRRTLRPVLNRFGMEARPDEDEAVTLFRPNLIRWLGDSGQDPAVGEYASKLARAYMEDPAQVDASLAGVALRLHAQNGNAELFETLRAHFEASQIPADRTRYLRALGSFRDRAVVEKALVYSVQGPLRPNEIWRIPMEIRGGNDEAQNYLWGWVQTNYGVFREKMPPPYLVFMPYFAMGCNESRISEAEAFFTMPEHSTAGTEKELAKVLEGLKNCADLRKREGAAVWSYLEELSRSPEPELSDLD